MWEMLKFVGAEGNLLTAFCVIGTLLGVIAFMLSFLMGQLFTSSRKLLVLLGSVIGVLVAVGVVWTEVQWRYNSFEVMSTSSFNEKVVKNVTSFKGTVTCVAEGLKAKGVYTIPDVEINKDLNASVNVALDTVDTDYKTACAQSKYFNSADQLDGSLYHSARSQIAANKAKIEKLFQPTPPSVNLSSTGTSSLVSTPKLPDVKQVAVTLDEKSTPALVAGVSSQKKPAVDVYKSISGQ